MLRPACISGASALAFVVLLGGCALPPRQDAVVTGALPAAGAMSANDASNEALLRAVQQSLNDQGFAAGAVDGQWNAATAQALRRLQIARGLPPTSDLDPETMAALRMPVVHEATAVTDLPAKGVTTYALPAAGAATPVMPRGSAPDPRSNALPPPMTTSGTTPSGMTTPGATPAGATTRPAAGTPPEQNSGTPMRTGTP